MPDRSGGACSILLSHSPVQILSHNSIAGLTWGWKCDRAGW
ncbi:MAG: hypothetical protein SVX43_10570 [Cyanobacteriota bacterium]|nr:hypothetical protein [Cyanobacteriota bacterium]